MRAEIPGMASQVPNGGWRQIEPDGTIKLLCWDCMKKTMRGLPTGRPKSDAEEG